MTGFQYKKVQGNTWYPGKEFFYAVVGDKQKVPPSFGDTGGQCFQKASYMSGGP